VPTGRLRPAEAGGVGDIGRIKNVKRFSYRGIALVNHVVFNLFACISLLDTSPVY